MNLKKTLPKIIKDNPDKEIFYFDESRFGTHSKIGHAWFKTGTRPEVKIKVGFNNFYLYSAINAKGDNFNYIFSKADTDCLNHFLQEFAKEYKNREIILIMDGAGWHKSGDLKLPVNIQKVLLPAYCPELNPVERLWQYIKNHTIKNKVFETIEDLENEICGFINSLTKKVVKNIYKNETVNG